jgi:translation elongation factor EF-1alpha
LLTAGLPASLRFPMKILLILSCALFLAGVVTGAETGKLKHVVCFKFKSTATPQDIQKVEEAFKQLKDKVPEVASLEWGTNVSTEQRNKGFTHCFLLSFKTDKDRDTYLEHPEHKAFVKIVGPVVDDVFVIDFWAK